MGRALLILAGSLGIVAGMSIASEGDSKAETSSLECTLYTKPYRSNEHGAFTLPKGVKWMVLPQYVGRDAQGKRFVDDRITLVLSDPSKRFWPFIAKMSVEEAEVLQEHLARVVAQRKGRSAP